MLIALEYYQDNFSETCKWANELTLKELLAEYESARAWVDYVQLLWEDVARRERLIADMCWEHEVFKSSYQSFWRSQQVETFDPDAICLQRISEELKDEYRVTRCVLQVSRRFCSDLKVLLAERVIVEKVISEEIRGRLRKCLL